MSDERHKVVSPRDIQPGPIRHSALPPEFVVRAQLVHHAFGDAAFLDFSTFLENFQRDANPMRELVIWERMASAFLALTSAASTREERQQAAGALLSVSMLWPDVAEATAADPGLRAAAEAFAVAGQMPRGGV